MQSSSTVIIFRNSNETLLFNDQVKQMLEKDGRIKIINEVLNGIKVNV